MTQGKMISEQVADIITTWGIGEELWGDKEEPVSWLFPSILSATSSEIIDSEDSDENKTDDERANNAK